MSPSAQLGRRGSTTVKLPRSSSKFFRNVFVRVFFGGASVAFRVPKSKLSPSGAMVSRVSGLVFNPGTFGSKSLEATGFFYLRGGNVRVSDALFVDGSGTPDLAHREITPQAGRPRLGRGGLSSRAPTRGPFSCPCQGFILVFRGAGAPNSRRHSLAEEIGCCAYCNTRCASPSSSLRGIT